MERVRLLNELKRGEENTPPESPAYLLLETGTARSTLRAHNSQGILLEETGHATLNAAKQYATAEFGARLAEWQEFPGHISSIAELVQVRAAEDAARIGTPPVMSYARPSSNAAERPARFREDLVVGLLLIASFNLIIICTPFPFPIGGFIWYQELHGGHASVWTPLQFAETGMLGIVASSLMWKFKLSWQLLSLASILTLVASSVMIFEMFWRDSSFIGLCVYFATALPFLYLAKRRLTTIRRPQERTP